MRAVIALALLVGCASSGKQGAPAPAESAAESATELPIPPDLRDQISRSCAIGRQLYVLDKVAAIGTDVLFANVPDAQQRGLAGYLPMREGGVDGGPENSFLVSFFTADTPPRIAYEIRVVPDTPPAFQAFTPPKEGVPGFATMVQARAVAIRAMPASDQPINPVLLPGEANGEKGVLVYLLAGTKAPHVAVFGRHFRALVPLGGTAVTYMMPLSKTALELPTRGAQGETVEALAVTQIVTDFPLETHVFTSLLVGLPVYVGTKRGNWLVDGDRIAFLGESGPSAAQ